MNKPNKRSMKTKRSSRKQAKPQKPKLNIWLLIGLGVLAVLVLGGPLLYMQFSKSGKNASKTPAPLPLEISTIDAFEKYSDEAAFFLDVRTQEEWNEFHIPNSTLIPLDQLASRISELPADREIVVVCRSGNRSAEGRDILLNAGFAQVTSMTGGLTDWRQAAFPTVTGP